MRGSRHVPDDPSLFKERGLQSVKSKNGRRRKEKNMRDAAPGFFASRPVSEMTGHVNEAEKK
jgi:hypothetical protein